MSKLKYLKNDVNGDAVVEATIIFPIMIMIFAALVILSIYLPTRAALQRSTQYAATVIATELSDTWLFYDLGSFEFYREIDKSRLGSVYSPLFAFNSDVSALAESIVIEMDNRLLSHKEGDLLIESTVSNNILFRDVTVTATRRFTPPVNLSFIGFPEAIEIKVTSIATVSDGDEFVRNIDLIIDFANYISEQFGFSNAGEALGSLGSRFLNIIGG